jgi:hypothetical protein
LALKLAIVVVLVVVLVEVMVVEEVVVVIKCLRYLNPRARSSFERRIEVHVKNEKYPVRT